MPSGFQLGLARTSAFTCFSLCTLHPEDPDCRARRVISLQSNSNPGIGSSYLDHLRHPFDIPHSVYDLGECLNPWTCPRGGCHTTMIVSTPSDCPALSHPIVLPADVGSYSYGVHHAMKPQRMRITHELVQAYDMLPKMHVLVRYPIQPHLEHSSDQSRHPSSSAPNARPQRP